MQIKNKSILRVALLAGSVFTCLIFTSTGLAAPPVTYSYPPVTSQIPVPLLEPVPNPIRPSPFYLPYGGPRSWAFADFNGDGRVDILVAPSLYTTYPKLPIQIWLQEPGGTFVNRTSDVIEGPVPITGLIADPLVADFNEDGRPDVLLVDTGLEDRFCPCDGEKLRLLLSQPNGRMVDASSRISPNPLGFYHNGSVADVDGDGHLDVMITDLGIGSLPAPAGVFFLMGDGQGNFTRSESRLPASIRFLKVGENVNVPDRHSTGGAAFADFDGDGRVDIVASAGFFDPMTGKQTVRFYRQMPNGTFVEQSRLEIPPALAGIGALLGAWRPGIGDFNGDGLPDLAIEWENIIPNYIQLLRNDGNFQFTDITIQALGSYQPQGGDCSICYIVKTVLADVNRDGFADLVLPYAVFVDDLLTTNAAVFLSEGDGRFSPWSLRTADGGPTAESLRSVLGSSWVFPNIPFFFDFDGDGQMDLLVVDHNSNTTRTHGLPQTTAVRLHLFRQVGDPSSVPRDFDGDRKTDIAVYRDGTWFILHSLGRGVTATGWGGLAQDVPVPGDYDGDRKTDLAIYRDGVWFIWRSSDGVQTSVGWGTVGDVPVQADYDGDGKTDQAVYRSGAWFIRRSSDGGHTVVGWGGLAQDIPVPADYDGDGKTDIAVYRDGSWFILRSSDGGVTVTGWGGLPQDKLVPADYDGDGKADIAVYRGGTWFIIRSSNGGVTVKGWGGLAQDIPVPADYDGDGKVDIAVYRDGGWFIIRSSDGGVTGIGWGGLPQDVPLN